MLDILLIVLGVAIFGIQHSGISALRIKNRIIDRFGKKGYSRIFNVTSILAFIISFLLMNYWGWLYFILNPELVNPTTIFLGVLLIIAGLTIASRASREISVSTVADMRSDRKPQLVTSGIYAKVRHPLYLATILMFLGLVAIYPFTKVIVYTFSMSLYIIAGSYLEERKLIIHYGQAYIKYKETTGFLLPRVSSKGSDN